MPTIPVLRELRASSGLSAELAKEAVRSDVIHNHGLWLMPNVYAGWAASRARTPLIVAPRGMLGAAALRFSRMKKDAVLADPAGAGGPSCRLLPCDEPPGIRRHSRLWLDPAGGHHPERHRSASSQTANRRWQIRPIGSCSRSAAFTRRRDWIVSSAPGRKWRPAHPGWRLRIVGPAELGHDAELRALAATLKLSRVSIEPAIYGERKVHCLPGSRFFCAADLERELRHDRRRSRSLRERRSYPRRVPPGLGSKWSAAAGGSITASSRSRPR